MKIVATAFCLTLLFVSPLFGAELLLQPNDRVALCGNGLGDTPASIYIETYLLATQPITGLDVAQFGWVAPDPAGMLAKLDSSVLPFKPTVVLTSFPPADPAAHEKDETALIDALKKAGVRTIVIGSLPAVDSTAFPNDPPARTVAENQNRAALAEIDKNVAAKEHVVYADVVGMTAAAIEKAKALHGDRYASVPGWSDALSLAMASAYFKALGCNGTIGAIQVDYAAQKAEGSAGQKILSFQNNELKIESSRGTFWFPGHGVGGQDPPPWPSLKCLTFPDELNRYVLTVKNVPTPMIKVYWGGDRDIDYSAEDLARGVNLQADIPGFGNPFANYSGGLDNGSGGQQEQERIMEYAAVQGKPDPDFAAKREAAFQVAMSRTAPIQYTMKFQPLGPPVAAQPHTVNVIFDTDIDGDVDDVGALALLNSFMDQGECNLIACGHDTTDGNKSSCATIQAINTWYGHPDIPIGQSFGQAGPAPGLKSVLSSPPANGYTGSPVGAGSAYTAKIHQQFDPDFPSDDKMPPAVDVYRKALASAPDHSVVFCTVGTMENIQDLIQSQPDSVSDLSGLELIRKKVTGIYIMANTQPADHYLLSKWPTPIVWTTYVGSGIGTGPSLIPTPENNPVRVAYDLFGVLHNGRQSWDLTAAWVAVRGSGDVWDIVAGRPQYINDITKSPAGPYPNECELTIKMPYDEVSKLIGEELARPPKK
jgi:hypothetical protein